MCPSVLPTILSTLAVVIFYVSQNAVLLSLENVPGFAASCTCWKERLIEVVRTFTATVTDHVFPVKVQRNISHCSEEITISVSSHDGFE